MRATVVTILAAVALSGCSGGFSFPKPNGGSAEAREQNYCQEKYAPLGSAAVSDCRADERRRRLNQ